MHSRRRLSLFDAVGLLSVAAFAAVVSVDLAELRWRAEEIRLELPPEALAEGFRAGTEWHAIYDAESNKIGHSRLERRSRPDGYEFTNYTRLRAGGSGDSEITVVSELDQNFELRSFQVSVQGELAELEATGRAEEGRIVIDVEGLPGGGSKHLELPAERPVFNFSLRPLVMRSDLRRGQRFSFEHFDPTTLSTRETSLEYLGKEEIYVMGDPIVTHHLRQEIAGQVLESWVNDLGEALREELPGGLVAVRESEAEATWNPPREDGGGQ